MDKLKEITEELNNIFTVVGDIRSSVVRVTGTVALGVVIKKSYDHIRLGQPRAVCSED